MNKRLFVMFGLTAVLLSSLFAAAQPVHADQNFGWPKIIGRSATAQQNQRFVDTVTYYLKDLANRDLDTFKFIVGPGGTTSIVECGSSFMDVRTGYECMGDDIIYWNDPWRGNAAPAWVEG